MSQFGIYFTKHSHLVEAFNEKIRALKPTGITNIWMTKYLDYKYLNIKEAAAGPQTLDFTELSGGFQVWAGGLIFATIAPLNFGSNVFCWYNATSESLITLRLQMNSTN